MCFLSSMHRNKGRLISMLLVLTQPRPQRVMSLAYRGMLSTQHTSSL